jgi:hypothetical protein
MIYGQHGMDATGQYTGMVPQQLKRMDIYKPVNSRYGMPHPHVTLEPGTMDLLHPSPVVFHPGNFVFYQSAAGKNWAN